MCVITVFRRDEVGQTFQATDSLPTAFCVFGKYCAAIGHSRIIYQDGGFEACPVCCEQYINIAQWSHEASSSADAAATSTAPAASASTTKPVSDADAVNRIAEAELLKILKSGDLHQYNDFASLLHYILSLPEEKVNKDRLLEIYGANLGQECVLENRKRLRRLVSYHDSDRKLVFFVNAIMMSDHSSADDASSDS